MKARYCECYCISYYWATFKTKYKIPDITNLATKASLNATATEIESKILDLTNLVTKATFNAIAIARGIENKIERK